MHKKSVCIGLILLMMGWGLSGCGGSDEPPEAGADLPACPMMPDKKIDKNIYVDYQGQRVYLCCEVCKNLFTKFPEKYMQKFKDAGAVLETIPAGDGS